MRTSEKKRLELQEKLGPEVEVTTVDRSSTHVLCTEYFLDGIGGLFWFYGYEGSEHWEVLDKGIYIEVGPDLGKALEIYFGAA